MKFKKIMSVLASAVMLSSTIGFAAAASYPAPFVSGGAEDAAIVYGAAADLSDFAAAVNIQTKLNALVTTEGSASASGGDNYLIEKSSTKFQLGYGTSTVLSVDITEDHLPTLLADGKYIDDDNDEFDYTQKIELANHTLGYFDDNDYADDEPTIGMRIANGNNVLNYTLDMSDEPLWTDLETSNLPILGKEYYVLTSTTTTNQSMTLLDSAVDTILAEGETTILEVNGKSYEVSVNFIGSTPEVKLSVDGELTNSLTESSTQKISDGAYVGIKDILYTSKDTGISKVEFSIGSGKLKLTSEQDIELNDETVSGVEFNTTAGSSTGTLGTIKLIWNADDDLFVADDSEAIMPGFESVKLAWGGMIYPAEETIKIESTGDTIQLKQFPLRDSTEDIDILYQNSSHYVSVGGGESDHLLVTPGGEIEGGVTEVYENGTYKNITWDSDTDDYFVVSWNDTSSSESYLMRINNIKTSSSVEYCDVEYRQNGAWVDKKTDAKNGTTFTIGNAEIKIGYIDDTTNTALVIPYSSGTSFTDIYSKEGLKIRLPWVNKTNMTCVSVANTTCTADITAPRLGEGQIGSYLFTGNLSTDGTGQNTSSCKNFSTTYDLLFWEEDKSENVATGQQFNLSIAITSSGSKAYVSDVVGGSNFIGTSTTEYELGDTDVYKGAVYGALGTLYEWDKSGDEYFVTLSYHGDETYGQVYIAAPETTITPGTTETGGQVLVVKDSEVDSVKDKNLIVVGGSCINTVAANIIGGALCTEEFTAKTGVGVGQYIIKTVASPYAAADSGKVAMLVAGYSAADTTTAVDKAAEGVISDINTEQVYPITSA